MKACCYRIRYHEALAKAFSARAESVRAAYFDLACFYRRKLNGNLHPIPSHEELQACLARLAVANDRR